MALQFQCTAPGRWDAHDQTGDYQVTVYRDQARVHMDVHGPAGDRTVDVPARDSVAGFILCQQWQANIEGAA